MMLSSLYKVGSTASASEKIVLQGEMKGFINGEPRIIGTPFWRQVLLRCIKIYDEERSMKLTTSRYYTPGGR